MQDAMNISIFGFSGYKVEWKGIYEVYGNFNNKVLHNQLILDFKFY